MATNAIVFLKAGKTDCRFDNQLLPKEAHVVGFMKNEKGVVVETIDDYYSHVLSAEQHAQFERTLVFARAVLLGTEDWLRLELEADLL